MDFPTTINTNSGISLSLAVNKSPGSSYIPGETIIGSLTVDVAAPQFRCEFLNLIFEGKAKVEIVERRTHTTHSSSSGPYYNSSFSGPNHYHAGSSSSGPSTDYHGGMSSSNSHTDYYYYIAEEIYLDSVIPLLKETDISKGRTVFPFQYALPTSDLPCNIEASNGAVTYVITAHVKGPNFGNEVIEKLPFVITPFLDLNTVPLGEFMVTEFEEWKEAGGCCCSRGPDVVKVRLNVPRRFFIPGEFIPVTVITENKTGSLLGVATVQLILTLTCTAQGKSREMEQNLGEIAGPVVKAGCMQTWVVNNLVVPIIKPVGIPPSGLGGCNIIDASYELRYYARLHEGSCSLNGTIGMSIPVMVGTVPLNTQQTSPQIIQNDVVKP